MNNHYDENWQVLLKNGPIEKFATFNGAMLRAKQKFKKIPDECIVIRGKPDAVWGTIVLLYNKKLSRDDGWFSCGDGAYLFKPWTNGNHIWKV